MRFVRRFISSQAPQAEGFTFVSYARLAPLRVHQRFARCLFVRSFLKRLERVGEQTLCINLAAVAHVAAGSCRRGFARARAKSAALHVSCACVR